MKYKFNENQHIRDLQRYIDMTYKGHYSGQYQATDVIIDAGHGTGFCIGNIMKYAKRYGKKDGYNRDDIMKILHYAIIQLYVHDQMVSNEILQLSEEDIIEKVIPSDGKSLLKEIEKFVVDNPEMMEDVKRSDAYKKIDEAFYEFDQFELDLKRTNRIDAELSEELDVSNDGG